MPTPSLHHATPLLTLRRSLLGACAALALLSASPHAHACAIEPDGPVHLNQRNPDLPLQHFFAGHLGAMLSPGGWSRPFLVAAYRSATGVALDDAERTGLVTVLLEREPGAEPGWYAPNATRPAAAAQRDYEEAPSPAAWLEARATFVTGPPPTIDNAWNSQGAWASNCLADAFRTAALTLRERAARYGAQSAAVRSWLDAQDAVFSNCGRQPGRMPVELAANAPAEQRRDRAWQLAAAHFYASHYDEAERRFRAIAADAGSPWALPARYLVVRTLTRAAQHNRPRPDAALLSRAAAEAQNLANDRTAGPTGEQARRYLGWINALRGTTEQAHRLGVELARAPLGARFESALRDYLYLLELNATALSRETDTSDRLTTWIQVLEERRPSSVAVELYTRSRASVWLLAALATPIPASGPTLDAPLEAARTLRRDDPLWLAVQYHRLRHLSSRGTLTWAEVERVRAQLTDEDGPTARNALGELALQTAPELERFLALAHAPAAGWSESEGRLVRARAANDAGAGDDFTPLAASAFSWQMPLSTLLRAARSTTLPPELRARLVSLAVHRAVVLDDADALHGLAPLLAAVPAPMRATLEPLVRAPSRDARRLQLLRSLLLEQGSLRVTTARLDGSGSVADALVLRCQPNSQPPPLAVSFLSPAERAQLTQEHARYRALEGEATFLANEAARLARAGLRAPELPRLLAAAVRTTRNNYCEPSHAIHAASRAAFTTLHQLFPRAPETAQTRYWY